VEETFKDQESTVGALFLTTDVPVSESKTFRFEIWDTAGQERFKSLGGLYYRAAKAALVVYDITSMASFKKAKEWVAELHQNADESVIIALVGNKLDLESNRQVPEMEARKYASESGLLFYEVSAKTGVNVKQAFIETAKKCKIQKNTEKRVFSIIFSKLFSIFRFLWSLQMNLQQKALPTAAGPFNPARSFLRSSPF
jgi:Ras-related protein Rab-5C